MKYGILFLLCLTVSFCNAQDYGFKFGVFGLSDLSATSFPIDTTANAVVLDEFGHGYIENFTGNLTVQYHIRIKILKRTGLDKADFEIPLRKNKDKVDVLRDVVASTFNLDGTNRKETKWNSKNIFTENRNEFYDLKKFTLPDVKVGSVIEVMYSLETPFIFNFWPWEFQGDVPKLHSEFWAKIPGNYAYNTTLKGPFKLSKNEYTIEKDCFELGPRKADCSLAKYAMTDVPAFKEEKYMTAKSNFLAALNFELSEVKDFEGHTNKFTKAWADVDQELKLDEDFGAQIRKAENTWKDDIRRIILGVDDPLKQAKIIFRYVSQYFTWDEKNSKYAAAGVKRAYDTKKGNAGDINLSLVGALQAANLKVSPVILSTRANGLPIMLHPVLSDFNYVVAQVEINGEKYLLDATEKYYPFGLLPQRCLNGKGRLIGKESMWVDLLPRESRKERVVINLTLNDAGEFRGTMTIKSNGYYAAEKREMIQGVTQEAYISKLQNDWRGRTITNYQVLNLEDLDVAITEQMDIAILEEANVNAKILYLDPFFAGKTGDNPFKSEERYYPVDFGAPLDRTLLVNIALPEKFKLEERPPKVGLALPQGGGRYLFDVTTLANKISVGSNFVLTRSLYGPDEYPSLREIFTQIIKTEQTTFVFTSK